VAICWPGISLHSETPVGAGLPAMAVGLATLMLNVTPLRGQARSHRIEDSQLFLRLVQQPEKPLPHLHVITVRHVES
jgi:hypothetical protein